MTTNTKPRKQFNDQSVTILFLLMVILSTIIIAYVKIDTFRAWRYTSDLFSFNTVIQENARGNWGLEFTFGNAFGDHAYLFLILLTPLKFLLGNQTIYVLLLMGPIAYGISSIILFFAVNHLFNRRYAFLISSIYLLGFSFNYPGLLEKTYGMHPDILSGYLAVIMTVVLMWRENLASNNKRTALLTIMAMMSLLLFVSLKEEMALLAFVYFFVSWAVKKNRLHLFLLLSSLLVFIGELVFIKQFLTPFNRTNGSIIDWFLNTVKENSLSVIFSERVLRENQPALFWGVIILGIMLFIIMFVYSKRLNEYVLSLFIIGLIKLGFSLAVLDLNITTWHNFPGLIMLTAAILLQFAQIKLPKAVIGVTVLSVLFLISLFCVTVVELPFIMQQLRGNSQRKDEVLLYTRELTPVMKMIDPLKVVSIPQYTARLFVGYRYIFYPGGVIGRPYGIADYVIYPINEATRLGGGYEKTFPYELIPQSFKEIERGKYFVFYKRISLTDHEKSNRNYFKHYGINY